MILNASLKTLVLLAILVGVEKQAIVAYYSLTPRQNIESSINTLTPDKTPPAKTNAPLEIASNIIMAWRVPNTNKIRHHSFNQKQFETLQKEAHLLPPEEFNYLIERSKNMSTETFIAYLKEKQDTIFNFVRIAGMN
jgi:hypothetical protein